MIACVQITTTAIATSPSPSTTTTTLAPTTTTMNFCVEEKGMNQPLTITPDQIQSNPQPQQTTPPGDINPTPGTPGLNYPSPNPQINVTLNQPTTLTVIYLPVDTPNKPSNVQTFQVVFVYPNATTSQPYTSTISSATTTTTTTTSSPSAGAPSAISTTPSSTAIVLPSAVSPQVDLPPNFQLPPSTIVVITITSTTDGSNPTGVWECFFLIFCFSIQITYELFCKASVRQKNRNEKRSTKNNIVAKL
jgi:hypothetical protein